MIDHDGTVLVVGSLNADCRVTVRELPGPGESVAGSKLSTSSGGKSANTAVAAALLGAHVKLLGLVGDDPNADLVLHAITAAGVDVTHVRHVSGAATGLAVITVDAHGENTIVVLPGANAQLDVRDVNTAQGFFAAGSVLCLCFEVADPVVQAAATLAHAAGAQVILNPSPYRPISRQLLDLTDVLVVNEHELADLTRDRRHSGRSHDDSSTVSDSRRIDRTLRRSHPRLVIITRGAAGAVLARREGNRVTQTWRVPAPRVDAIDTTGCGDAFLGALAHRLAAGDEPGAACALAVQVASFAATRRGTQTSYPTAADLAEFASSVNNHAQRRTSGARSGGPQQPSPACARSWTRAE